MKALVTGAGGLLSRQVAEALARRGLDVSALPRAELDVADERAAREAVSRLRPDAIVNAAAMTDVDRCERDPDVAMRVNGEAPGWLAEAARDVGAVFCHVSTDYVFDGRKGEPYLEDDEPNPLQAYGRSKLEGERRVAAVDGESCAVIRSAWIYGPDGKNFFSRLDAISRDTDVVRAAFDQRSSPTFAPDLAGAIADWVTDPAPGLFQVTNAGGCSAAELCRVLLKAAGRGTGVEEVPLAELRSPGRPAPRPADTRLDCGRWSSRYVTPRHWREAAEAFGRTWA